MRTQLLVLRAAPFVAWSFGKLRVSGGVHVDAGRLQIQRNLDFIDTQGDVRLDLDGRGLGARRVAVYCQARADLGLGLVYRSRTRIAFDGNANFTAPDAFADKTPDQPAATSMTMPDLVVLGAHWRRGAVSALARSRVHAVERQPGDRRSTSPTPATPDAVQRNDWHDTTAVRAGGEWQRDLLVLRGGGVLRSVAGPDRSALAVVARTPIASA